jgi:hypothetical protein
MIGRLIRTAGHDYETAHDRFAHAGPADFVTAGGRAYEVELLGTLATARQTRAATDWAAGRPASLEITDLGERQMVASDVDGIRCRLTVADIGYAETTDRSLLVA